MAVFASIGLGRFALGMLLPSMGASLGLSYAEMGTISTVNFVGYLVSVVAVGHLLRRLTSRFLIAVSLILVGATIILISRADGFFTVMGLYFLTGIGSGGGNLLAMALVAHWFTRRRRGRAAGFMVCGSGLGIVFSGMLVPWVNAAEGAEGWRTSWLIIGLACLGIAAVCAVLIKDNPRIIGLDSVGGQDSASPAAPPALQKPLHKSPVLLHLGTIYFLFGYTYVIYATFIVTALVQERGFSEAAAGQVWAWIGLLSLLSGPVFGSLSDRLGRKAGMMIVFATQTAAYLLVAADLPVAYLYLSIALFGIVAWSIPSIMAAAAGDYMGAERAAAALGLITFIFGFGQMLGPAIAGMLADQSGSFQSSFTMTAALAGLAVVLTAFLRKPH
ncbi:MAG: YbfB/YjiJ family MFS transporter [Rhodospirillales bacterium]|nr:YbfB/YjiJ family MFS transporter [Rhodospirillales bacterium]